ncbi:MmgE/PrpD family protein [Arthrobacter sp. zg-Y411]|uniref:MmgE/PrpD family protein n=1 Tax=Arthrobacter zhangbolii TaxID=2886936 RepID=UPI001D146424|nr:MmgE/PrpD family protein [Arthrobacter zhangbolii]MCC3296146.1 MmgE/PrpD family protein [Arthrobacter zhangbolii]
MNEPNNTGTLLESLAHYANRLDPGSVPQSVHEQAALCLLDTVGCIVAGSRVAESGLLFDAEAKRYGAFEAWPAEVTARVLGYFGDTLELNDLIGGHSSIGVVTAALAAGRDRKISGEELLTGIVAGTEVTARLYESAVGRFKRYSEGGSVMVSYFNAVGAAAALSVMSSFDDTTTTNAMAIAASMNSWCPAEVIFGQGGTIKPMLFGGNPAACAVLAAGYAAEGLTGPRGIIESPIGMMAGLATSFDPSKILDTERWYITAPQRKMHAACGYTHSSIDAAGSLHLSVEEQGRVESIDVAVPAFFKEAVGKEGRPKSANDARFHLGYVVSLALQGLYPILPEHTEDFDRIFGQGLTASLSDKVRIVPNDGIAAGGSKPYNIARVTVHFNDGEQRSQTCTSPIGSSENPMSGDDVVNKFIRLVSPAASEETAVELAERILKIGTAADVRPISEAVLELVRQEMVKR